MPRLRLLLVFAAVVLAMTCAPAAARAQSILGNIPDRITTQGDLGETTRPDNQNPLGISYADCVADMTLRFTVQLSGFGGQASLQVWASLGSGCVAPQDRGLDGGTAVCWGVNPGILDPTIPTQLTTNVDVRVQDLVGWQSTSPLPSPAMTPPRKGTEACTAQQSYPAVPMVINFLAIDDSGNPVGTPYQYSIQTDLVGPPPPVLCETVGDTIYNLQWTPNPDTDTVGYGVYIDPIPGQEPRDAGRVDAGTIALCDEAGDEASASDDGGCATLALGSMPPDSGSCGSAVSELTCNDSNLVGSITPTIIADAGTPTPADAGDGGTADAGTADTGAADGGGDGGVVEGPGGISTVSTAYLYQPTTDASSITVSGSTSSYTIQGLVDYVTYTVVVSAVDGMGNVGPPSAEVCDYPAPVQDFWQVYEADGGGKGGYCALETVGVGGPSLAGVAGVFVVAGFVRRRRKRR
jgi:hypothetical protein